ncbi:MAG: 2OG-Fe(II) oxygenase [Alphaproteobacteria bacterium]|nr:2OG-Fe(II) oxygenase [Alphaproteobacteria bacterium]
MSSDETARTRVDVQPIFATPVVFAPLPNADAVNAALREAILARAETHPSTAHSNLGGWQSSWDLPEWGGEEMRHLMTFVRQLADRLTADRSGKPAPQDWRTNAWANVNRAGHGNEFHTHPGCVWSAVYYVDDGGAAADPSLGGEFEIQDPRGVAPAMYRPDLVPAVQGGVSMGASETIQPAQGTVMMFPSWVSHAVRPYTGEGTRISIAINLS